MTFSKEPDLKHGGWQTEIECEEMELIFGGDFEW